MKLRLCNNKQEIIDFVLENTAKDYSKMFTEHQVENMLYIPNDSWNGEFKDNIKDFKNEPESYPINVLLSEPLYDQYHCKISSGISYLPKDLK